MLLESSTVRRESDASTLTVETESKKGVREKVQSRGIRRVSFDLSSRKQQVHANHVFLGATGRNDLWYSQTDLMAFDQAASNQAKYIATNDRRSAGWQRVFRRVYKTCQEARTEHQSTTTASPVIVNMLTQVYAQAPNMVGLERRIWEFVAQDATFAHQTILESMQRTRHSPCTSMLDCLLSASSQTVSLGSRLLARDLAFAQAAALCMEGDDTRDGDATDSDSEPDSDDED